MRTLPGCLLLWACLASPCPASAQGVDPGQLEELQRLWGTWTPGERLRAIESLRQPSRAEPESAAVDLGPSAPVDDRYRPHPWGAAKDSSATTDRISDDAPPARFGEALFQQAPETFQPVKYGPVPDDYRLGHGDEVVVEVWGDVTFRDSYVVDREGAILLREAGRAMVAGRTLAEAEADITRRLARVISGIQAGGGGSTFVEVSLGRLRSIRVFVVGEARRPGGYEVSSAATVFQALYAAGGPSELGSLRDVRLLRDDYIVSRLDLYEYLLEGTRSGDETLRDGDTVFLPVATKVVTVRGAVRRPLRFELTGEEDLRDVLRMAGGPTPTARTDLVHLERIVPAAQRRDGGPARVEVDVLLPGLDDDSQGVALLDGDVVHVLEVNDRREMYVSVGGSVTSPGRYGFERGMRVSDLLRRANGLWRDAFLERAVLVHVKDDYTRASSTLTLADLQEGGGDDLLLAPMDSLHVFSQEKMRDRQEVSVFGEVRRPGLYPYFEGMTLQDLVLAAHGLGESADVGSAEVSRLQRSAAGDSLAVLVEVPLGLHAALAGDFPLQNRDNVFVRARVGFKLQRNVSVSGEVARPGVYTLTSRRERLSDVIERAGGLLESAYPAGMRLTRPGVGDIGLDLARALHERGGSQDVLLQGGDAIEIPPLPSSVTVEGEVGHPTAVVFHEGKGIGYYVARAGGYTKNADKGRAHVVLPNGIARPVRRLWPDPEVVRGSTISVPSKQQSSGIDWGNVIVRTSQVAAAVATIFIATN